MNFEEDKVYNMVEKSSEIIFNILYVFDNGTEAGGPGFQMFDGDLDLFQTRFYENTTLRAEKTILEFNTPFLLEFDENKHYDYYSGADYENLKTFCDINLMKNVTEKEDG